MKIYVVTSHYSNTISRNYYGHNTWLIWNKDSLVKTGEILLEFDVIDNWIMNWKDELG